VLVVVKHRDLHAFAQPPLDLEAFRRLDVLKVDAAESRFEAGDDIDELVGIGLGDLDVEHVDAGKFLEQAGLALHDGLAGERTDRAEPKDSGAVGDDCDQVGARGQLVGLGGIAHDLGASGGNAGRISECKIALVAEPLGRQNRNLPRGRQAVVVERGAA